VFKTPLQQWSTPPADRMPFVTPAQADTLLEKVLKQYPDAAPNLLLTLDARLQRPLR
jgi:hypothetical protein